MIEGSPVVSVTVADESDIEYDEILKARQGRAIAVHVRHCEYALSTSRTGSTIPSVREGK